jgi:hypothetical protein
VNAEVHQHPDGFVCVRTQLGTYIDTPENFVADFGATLPAMPQGADDHIYTQGRRHAFMGDGNIIAGGPMPWPDGDRIIDEVKVALEAQAARRASLVDG